MLLVVGSARSGTTWLGKIFDSHPHVIYRHEPDSVHKTTAIPRFDGRPYNPDHLEWARTYLLALREVRTIKVVGVLPIFAKSYFTKPALALHWSIISSLKLGERLPIIGTKLRKLNIPNFHSSDQQTSHVIKSIDALGRVGLFMAACPWLRTVLIVRHPCGHVASFLRGIRTKKFESDAPIIEEMGLYKLLAETRQARDLGIDFAAFRAMQPIERLTWHWAINNTIAMEALSGSPRGRIIRYEDLCENSKHISQSLFDFVELDWNSQTEKFVNASTEFSGVEGYYGVFRDSKKSPHKWHQELKQKDTDKILRIAEQTLPGRFCVA
jgi:hypothetical protein